MMLYFIFTFFILVSQLSFGATDVLYKKARPEFIQLAYSKFEKFYFSKCPEHNFQPTSIEYKWMKSQQVLYKDLGQSIDSKNKFNSPMYSWKTTAEKNSCHSVLIPRLEKAASTELANLLKKHNFNTANAKDVVAIEFLFEPKQIVLYLQSEGKTTLLKTYFVKTKLHSSTMTYSTSFKDIGKAIDKLDNPSYFKKIGTFIFSGLIFSENNNLDSPVFFLLNMYPGFLQSKGDQLVQEVLREFHFKPRAISSLKNQEFILYYP